LLVAIDHLLERGRPARLKTAVLHHKRVSGYLPDYFAEEVVEWRWIIYPWAVMEDLSSLWEKMQPRPASLEVFSRQLQRLYGLQVPDQMLEDVLICNR
jgi:hypoxanthine phosphoribosyltransferase